MVMQMTLIPTMQRALTASRVAQSAVNLHLNAAGPLVSHAQKRVQESQRLQAEQRMQWADSGLCRRCGHQVWAAGVCRDCADDLSS